MTGTPDGTQERPYTTIGEAIGKASRIYVCGESFTENVTLPSGSTLYGALDCKNAWRYDATKKSALTAAADTIPLKVIAGEGEARVEDFAVTAADAEAPGGSSIAVVVDGATAALVRSDLTAGTARAGENGASLPQSSALDGENGLSGTNMPSGSCGTQTHIGGLGGAKMCRGVDVGGGNGGAALGDPGLTGQEGKATGFGTSGDGGLGQVAGGNMCQTGQTGHQGMNGSAGMSGSAVGTLNSDGYAGANGTAGEEGEHGQGGGGGGASACTSGNTGPSGGGGGPPAGGVRREARPLRSPALTPQSLSRVAVS
jgi:hypothetical protein